MATGKLVMSMALVAFPMQMAVAQQPEPEQTAAPDAQSQQATPMSGAATGSTRSGPERHTLTESDAKAVPQPTTKVPKCRAVVQRRHQPRDL